MKFCASSSRDRASWRWASASSTWSLAICARSLATLASSLRVSSVNSSSPARTVWPSRTWTRLITPLSWGLTSTADTGTTLPVANSDSASWRLTAATVLTGTAGAAEAGLAPEPAAPPGWAVGLLSPQALSASAPARARVAVANDVDSFFIIWVQAWQIR